MKRQSYLLYNEARTELRNSQSTDGDILFSSQFGVPILWIFAFGGRNIWIPGDDVEDRGGAVGRRNPYETQIEVATTRLEQAEDILKHDDHLWPWVSAMTMFRRKLSMRPKASFIRVSAPWIIGLEDAQIERWKAATAFAENCVNLVGSGRRADGLRSLTELSPFCPFVPTGYTGDLDLLKKHPGFESDPLHVRLAMLTVGAPDQLEVFVKVVERDCLAPLQKYESLPPIHPPKNVVAPGASGDKSGVGGLLGKLTGIFKKK